jgi:uncharacterized protein
LTLISIKNYSECLLWLKYFSMIEVMAIAEVEDFLKHQLVGRIGCHADGITYVVPITYAYSEDYIYSHSEEGMKMYLMRKNPHLCFQVDNFQNLDNWKSVIAWGVFEELTNETERRDCIQHLRNRILPMRTSQLMQYSEDWPFSESEGLPGIFYRIKLIEKTGRFERSEVRMFYE